MIRKILLIIFALTLSLFTGCTADPTGSSSAPSSDAPSSSAPSSSEPSSTPSTSSKPELPPLNLSIPMNGESMQYTISPWGYVDHTGAFHYSPKWYTDYKASWPANQKDTQNIKDGTSGVKSICWVMRDSDAYMYDSRSTYVLMKDGTLRLASVVPFGNKDAEAFRRTDFDVLYAHGNKGDDLPDIFALDFSENNGATYGYVSYQRWMPEKNDQIAAFEYVSEMYLYIDGTIGFTKYENDTAAKYFRATDFSSWTDLVQIESAYYNDSGLFAFGLKKDGTVLCTNDAFLPEKFHSNVVRMFDGYMQHRDGSVYDLTNRKELGQFEKMDQIFPCGMYVLGVDTTGKVHCLSHKVEDLPKDSAAAWACTLTDVKTVWND